MIDTRSFEKLQMDMQQAIRDYTEAENEIKDIKQKAIDSIDDVGIEGLETNQILDEMYTEVSARKETMRLAKDEFRKIKNKMLEMIGKIQMPRSYY